MKRTKNKSDRRGFLKGAVAGAAAFAAQSQVTQVAAAQPQEQSRAASPGGVSVAEARTIDRPGSDFMMDVFKQIGFEYVFANPGGSFGGLHESVINYCNNQPEFITCMHEESSIAMAHGYAKIEGKPVLTMAHGTVGLQHASMALYNAWCDRVPIYMVIGNSLDATHRGGEVGWDHSVQDAASMVRDFTKWDDTPISLQHFAESAVRAYKIAMTPPTLPVVLVADTQLQDEQIPSGERLTIPKLALTTPPAGDQNAVAEIAKILVAAENPMIVTGRSGRTAEGVKLLVELAETLQCGVSDQHLRMNFPMRHPLYQEWRGRAALADADVILGLETVDFYGTIRARVANTAKPLKVITINSGDLYLKSNYQDFQRYTAADIAVAADAEATLPALIEACKKLITGDRKIAFAERGKKLAEASSQAADRLHQLAAYGWDASPITTARVSAELWAQIQNEDWSYVSDGLFFSFWPLKLWDMKEHYNYIGNKGGAGIGYGSPAAVGAAVANRKHGRLTINIQSDGDFMYAPGVLWTAAHHKIPMLTIMHNNRAYHQEVMGIQGMADRRSRGIERIGIGTKIEDPFIDYANLAKSLGVRSEGPIKDPKDLAPAIKRGIQIAKNEPYLIDVWTQGR